MKRGLDISWVKSKSGLNLLLISVMVRDVSSHIWQVNTMFQRPFMIEYRQNLNY